MTDPAALRQTYLRGHLDDDDVAGTWFAQLQRWFADALADDAVVEPNAVQLATADASGRPSVRTVLVKAMSEDGIVVYTNYTSAKAHDLAVNPQASAVFAWLPLQRQVRLTGAVRKVDRATTEAYFASRPRGSQLGAWASPQSQVVGSRDDLDARETQVAQRFGDGPIPPPPDWGGYLLVPDDVEFWQGRANRLHDRIRFRLDGTGWVRERLAP
jgi:pyridoxamine 5'-phosphate oxidase